METAEHMIKDQEKTTSSEEEIEAVSKITSNSQGIDDIIHKIFSRLPIRYLCRFKCVSKKFLTLTTNPLFSLIHSTSVQCRTPITGFFIRKATSIPKMNNGWWNHSASYGFEDTQYFHYLLTDSDSGELPDPSLNFLKQDKDDIIDVLDSCNGLLLCLTKSKNEKNPTCFVCNPLTKQKVSIPYVDRRHASYALFSELTCKGSFCFKVICVHAESRDLPSRLSLFSLDIRSWKSVDGCFPCLALEFFNKPKVVFDGVLFWGCFDGSILVFGGKNQTNTSCFQLIEAPNNSSLWDHNGKLLCYFRSCAKPEFKLQQICFPEHNKYEWKTYKSDEFDSIETDIWDGYMELTGKRVEKPFTIIAYNPKLKTLFVYIPHAIFSLDMSERKLTYLWGRLTSKYELCNYALPYVYSFSSIQKY